MTEREWWIEQAKRLTDRDGKERQVIQDNQGCCSLFSANMIVRSPTMRSIYVTGEDKDSET